jgi:hypothetical protein
MAAVRIAKPAATIAAVDGARADGTTLAQLPLLRLRPSFRLLPVQRAAMALFLPAVGREFFVSS